jgi:predicted transposase YdaD
MGLFPVAASSHTEAASSCRRRSDNLEAIQAMLNIITTNDLRHTRFYRDVFREGEAELILRLLARRCGVLSAQQKSRIMALPKEKLDRLGDAFLDFTDMADLEAWLKPLN